MALLKAGMLEKFFTTMAYFERSYQLKSIIKDINRREFNESLRPFTETHPWPETGRHIFNRFGLHFLTNKENSPFGINAVYKSLDKHLAKKIRLFPEIEGLYGYEDGSYYSFSAARNAGLYCIYELPIAYWQTARRLLTEEAERWPEWKNTMRGGISDSKEKLDRKTAELQMANVVITPSKFVADSLPRWADAKKVVISPFGTPANAQRRNKPEKKDMNHPLRILFAGSMGQRKGLADLFEAMKLLNTSEAELIVLGSPMEPLSFYKKIFPALRYEPPRPNEEVLTLMENCDVLCLPSIVEGRALVIQEAMSRGLPVIITENTGGEDLVKEGETGFLVPIRSPEAIAEKISWFLEHRPVLEDMRDAAMVHAMRYTWENYAARVINALNFVADPFLNNELS